tara:strand:+ start:9377 stop:9703 length:327 start_codon:yes stop_codon:yes gene_type:complete
MTAPHFDNIFEAITDDSVKAGDLQLRSDLLIMLRVLRVDKDQAASMQRLRKRLPAADVQRLVAGQLDQCPLDLLFRALYSLGYRIRAHYHKQQLHMLIEDHLEHHDHR